MKFLPFESFVIETTQTPDEVRKSIEANLDNSPFNFFAETGEQRSFSGYTLDGSFNIDLTDYRNLALINIKGSVTAIPNGSRIKATMKMSTIKLACIGGILSLLLFFDLFSVLDVLIKDQPIKEDLVLYIVTLVIYGILILDYNMGSANAKRLLIEIINPQPIEEEVSE